MASPISFTIEDRRCWTTERVMGSIILALHSRQHSIDETLAGF
jgi:hypothetical protein